MMGWDDSPHDDVMDVSPARIVPVHAFDVPQLLNPSPTDQIKQGSKAPWVVY